MPKKSEVAVVPTGHASRYLQQLCQHWARHLGVTFSPRHGKVTFPKDGRGGSHEADATARFDAFGDVLIVRVDASSAEQLNLIKQLIAQHLNSFASRARDALSFEWLWIDERDLTPDLLAL